MARSKVINCMISFYEYPQQQHIHIRMYNEVYQPQRKAGFFRVWIISLWQHSIFERSKVISLIQTAESTDVL